MYYHNAAGHNVLDYLYAFHCIDMDDALFYNSVRTGIELILLTTLRPLRA